MNETIRNSISLVSHIHSLTADFVLEKLSQEGLPDFASSHGNILYQLSQTEYLSMGELAKKINRDKSTTTVLVRKLINEGLIQEKTDSKDRRNRYISLTEKGNQYNQITKSLSEQLLTTFYNGFSEEEKQQFLDYLIRIKKNFS